MVVLIADSLFIKKHCKIALVIDRNQSISYELLAAISGSFINQINSIVSDPHRGFIQLFDENHLLIYSFLAASSLGPNTIIDPKASLEEVIAKVGNLNFKYILCNKGTVKYALKLSKIIQCGVILVECDDSDKTPEIKLKYIEPIGEKEKNPSLGADIALILHTSGSTGTPKCVPLTHTNIITNIKQIAGSLMLSEQDSTLCLMPLFHVHGLFASLLASLISGGTVHLFSKSIDFGVAHDILSSENISWYSAVPTIHHQIINTKKTIPDYARCKLRFIRSSSSPLTHTLYERLRTEFKVPVIQAYGMTETSHQIATQSYKEDAVVGSVGHGTVAEIKIMSADGVELPANEQGEVVVKGNNVFGGYLFLDNTPYFINGYFRTGDIGYFDEQHHLFLVSRIKEFINKGGEKIPPLVIDEALLKYPGVVEAIAYAVPHDTLYEDINAVVVIAAHAPVITQAEIKQFLYQHLSENQIPSQIHFVDHIPKSKTGKIQRVGLYKKYEKKLSNTRQKPTTELETLIYSLYSKELKISDFDIQDNFFELGGNSLIANSIIYSIYTNTGISIDYKTMVMNPSVYELAKELSVNTNSASDYYEFYEFFVSKVKKQRA